jgi:hypothetical protein
VKVGINGVARATGRGNKQEKAHPFSLLIPTVFL